MNVIRRLRRRLLCSVILAVSDLRPSVEVIDVYSSLDSLAVRII